MTLVQNLDNLPISQRSSPFKASIDTRQPLWQQAAEQLRDWIVRGKLAPGQRVVERTLCRQLGVSRTPFREALKILEGEGLVVIAMNKGARVSLVTAQTLIDLFDVLSDLEGLAAFRAASRMSAADMQRLESLHEQMISAFRRGDRDTYFELNSAVHDLIVALSRNLALATAREKLVGQARRGRYLAIEDRERWHRSVEEHEALMGALRRRDSMEAGCLWSAHLIGTGERIGKIFGNEPSPSVAIELGTNPSLP